MTAVGLLGATSVYFQASLAAEPAAAVRALQSTMLFMHRLLPFSSTLVPFPAVLFTEVSIAY